MVKLIKENFPVKLREGVILKSCEHIESISDVLTRMEWGKVDLMDDILNDIKDFDYSKKTESLTEIKYLSLKNEAFFVDKKGVTIASKIDLEIEKLQKLNEIKRIKIISPTDKTVNTIQWKGDKSEFLELIKALIVNGNIDINTNSQKETITVLSKVFNIEIKNPDQALTKIKNRNNGSETLFLNKLKKSLFDYITLEKKK